jgi:hypothetical protein
MVLALVGCATAADDADDVNVDVSASAPTHHAEDCPGGGTGGDGTGGEPSPIPAPRDCTAEPTWEQCYACCDWNEKHSWGETYRRLKRREDRAACWRRLEGELRPQRQKSCNRPGGPITTVAP